MGGSTIGGGSFRFYGPTEGYIDKTWVLNDFELLE
jgi:hypothetical protein